MPTRNEIVVGVKQESPTTYILGRYVSPRTIRNEEGHYETVLRVVALDDWIKTLSDLRRREAAGAAE